MWTSVGYYNGTIGPLEEMMVPMGDRALFFGDGIYEATYVVNGVAYGLEDHLDRMYNSLRMVEIPFTMEREALKTELYKVVDAAEKAPGLFLYWQISRGVCPRNHPFPDGAEPALMIYVTPRAVKPMEKTYKLISMEDIRFRMCNVKTLNLLPNVLASQRAAEAGCDETVFHRGERVTECSHSNISILKDGVLRTAPADELILPGIMRKHLLAMAGEMGIPTAEEPYTMTELMNADEVIVTSSGTLCTRVESVDGVAVGGKDPQLLARLQNAFAAKFERDTQVRT